MNNAAKNAVANGRTSLGIEFGSTRIKAVLIDETCQPIASGSHDWENRLENGIWTYSLDDIREGLQDCYKKMTDDVMEKYGVKVEKIGSIGFSAMMHGYMPFDASGELLVPFRTWRNTITGAASEELTKLFDFNIPQRWSIAHLYQAILNGESHVGSISYLTTLAGYIHWKLSGEKVLGIGEASGMFPIDSEIMDYDAAMTEKFDTLVADKNYPWKLKDILPKVLKAGENAGTLTAEGAKFLDPTGTLQAGSVMCPPEGDAGTGMVATNSVAVRTGNVSAGTSVFAMVVLDKALSKAYPEIDMVTTPTGMPVAMVHSNNCTSDINAWVNIFREFAAELGVEISTPKIYDTLYFKAMEGDADCGGLMSYCYFSGEHITGLEEGRPMFVRTPDSKFTLANFMRTHLYSALGALKVGMDILLKKENVQLDCIFGHGGLFKTEGVGQKVMAASMNVPVSVMETAGEGGAWGIALLARFAETKECGTLDKFLSDKVFAGMPVKTVEPDSADVDGFNAFADLYVKTLPAEKVAVECMK